MVMVLGALFELWKNRACPGSGASERGHGASPLFSCYNTIGLPSVLSLAKVNGCNVLSKPTSTLPLGN